MPLTIPTTDDIKDDLLVNATTEVLEAISAAGITNDDISKIDDESTRSKKNLMKEYFQGKLLKSIVKHDSKWDGKRPYYSAILAFLLSKQIGFNADTDYNKSNIADGMNQFAIKLIQSKKLVPAFISETMSYENGDATPGIDKLLLGSVFKMGTQDEIEKSFKSQKDLLTTLTSSVEDPKDILKSFNSRMDYLRGKTNRDELKEKFIIGQRYKDVDQLREYLQLQEPKNSKIVVSLISKNLTLYNDIKYEREKIEFTYITNKFKTLFFTSRDNRTAIKNNDVLKAFCEKFLDSTDMQGRSTNEKRNFQDFIKDILK